MILHLRKDPHHGLALWGEAGGVTVDDTTLANHLAHAFTRWSEPLLYGRGVLHFLQACLRRSTFPDLVLGDDIREALTAFRAVAKLVAAGRIVPTITANEARWKLTTLPLNSDPDLYDTLADLWMRTTAGTTLTRAEAKRHTFYTPADAWLNALRVPSPRLHIEDATLAEEVNTWSAPAFASSNLHLRITAHDATTWNYTFGVRTPENLLLLGQAIALAPTLAQPLPWDKAALQNFLTTAIAPLRSAGFRISLPVSLEPQVPTLEATIHALDKSQETVTIAQTITFGKLTLSLAEAQALVDAGDPLVFYAGKWYHLDLCALRQRLAEVFPETLSLHKALPLLFSGALRIAPSAQAVQNFLREIKRPHTTAIPLEDILRPYQAQGVCWMRQALNNGLGVCLADDMGLGKTIQAIAILLQQKPPALIVAPLTVLPVWERELQRFAPHLRIYRHEGANRSTLATFDHQLAHVDIVLTAYGYLWRDYALLRRKPWETLILDEAQHIKNPLSRQSQAARALTAKHRLALTGTPIENSLTDLWSILDFLNPNLFGTVKSFCKRYETPARLQRMVSHFLLRRLKSDPAIASDLPPKIHHDLFTPLTPQQAHAYDSALAHYADTMEALPHGQRRGAVLTLLMRLRQICDHPDLPLGEPPTTLSTSGKLLALLPLLEEITSKGESVLIFTQFVPMGKALQTLLAERMGHHIPFVHGALSTKQRRAEIEIFNQTNGSAVLILSLRTGAFGLTLTKANHVIHFDRWWNPAVEAQATDRVHRIGQKRTVLVHTLRCRGTLEDRIDQLLSEKQLLAESIISATPADLLSLLKRSE